MKYIKTLENYQPPCVNCNATLEDKKNTSADQCDKCYAMKPDNEMGLTEKGSKEEAKDDYLKKQDIERARYVKVRNMKIGELLKRASKKQHFSIDEINPDDLREFILDNDLD